MKKWSKLTKYQAFWPFVILLAIIVFNGIITGGSFFQMKIVDGHLYGRVIDIIRNGSKLMILAAGMTMVLATGGTDISVGSVMAISGAVACSIISGSLFPAVWIFISNIRRQSWIGQISLVFTRCFLRSLHLERKKNLLASHQFFPGYLLLFRFSHLFIAEKKIYSYIYNFFYDMIEKRQDKE